MKTKKVFIIFGAVLIFTLLTSPLSEAGVPNLAAHFDSNVDLINGWYWLRDSDLQDYAQWIFERIPSGDFDLMLDITALAADRPGHPGEGRGFPVKLLLIYETPGGKTFITQEITLPNSYSSSDHHSYTCNGQVIIPRVIMQDSTTLFVRIERILPEDNYLAFHAESIAIMRAAETGSYPPSESSGQFRERQVITLFGYQADKFYSNGSLNNGWYWLRDSALQHYAEWIFQDIPSSDDNLMLDITALATDRVNGRRGYPAIFRLICWFPGTQKMGGVFQTKEILLPNISSSDDPVGYTCQSLITIPRSLIAGATNFFFRVERLNPNDNHVAFNQGSIILFTKQFAPGFSKTY